MILIIVSTITVKILSNSKFSMLLFSAITLFMQTRRHGDMRTAYFITIIELVKDCRKSKFLLIKISFNIPKDKKVTLEYLYFEILRFLYKPNVIFHVFVPATT